MAQIIKNALESDLMTTKGTAEKRSPFDLTPVSPSSITAKKNTPNGSSFVFVPGTRDIPNGNKDSFETVFGTPKKPAFGNMIAKKTEENIEFLDDLANDLLSREDVLAEQNRILRNAEIDAEQIRSNAENSASSMLLAAQKEVKDLYSSCAEDCAAMRAEALESGRRDGYELGHSEGLKRGYEDGYDKALNKCKDTLNTLLSMVSAIKSHKEEFFREYENKLFDTVFAIANKVTVNSLKQKDKLVIQKMLRETAKNFRTSQFVKVKLAKLDVDDIVDSDLEVLKTIFRPNQHVEFEVLKEGERGTVIVSDDSVKIDASAMTQLKLIEDLGKGKFKNR